MHKNQLMKYLDIKSSSLSEIVSKLEKNNLIYKLKSQDDKRKTLLFLTPSGEEIAKDFEKTREANANLLFSELTNEEKNQLQKLLNKLIPHWKNLVKNKED